MPTSVGSQAPSHRHRHRDCHGDSVRVARPGPDGLPITVTYYRDIRTVGVTSRSEGFRGSHRRSHGKPERTWKDDRVIDGPHI
eukprot:2793476-Rhodomonas_salina.1